MTVSNAKIFDEPVFNCTRQFPYIWEEMRIPISFKDDRNAAERILLDAAERHTLWMMWHSHPRLWFGRCPTTPSPRRACR